MYEGKGTHLFVPLDVVPTKSNKKTSSWSSMINTRSFVSNGRMERPKRRPRPDTISS